jgi:hypothetical protein
MAKETQPAEVGDQIQILELHPSDYYLRIDPDRAKVIRDSIVCVLGDKTLLQIMLPDATYAGLLNTDGYPYYTIHKRAKDVTKNK